MFKKKNGTKAFTRVQVLVFDKATDSLVACYDGENENEAIRNACANLLESPLVKSFPDDFECIVHTFNVPDVREPLTYLGEVFNPTKVVM